MPNYVENYFSGYDYGDYSRLNNYIYKRSNELVGMSGNYRFDVDNDQKSISYNELTMDYDDNGIKGGTDHNIYTPEEIMIILDSVSKLTDIPGYKISLRAPGDGVNSIEFDIPCDGILRYKFSSAWDQSKDSFTINDVKMDIILNSAGFEYGINELKYTIPIKVYKNDNVKVVRNTGVNGYLTQISFYFLPFTYPWE